MFLRMGLAALVCGLAVLGPGRAVASAQQPAPGEAPYADPAERIEKHRKADVVVTVVDAEGKPVPGARVEVEQTRHAFLFGCNIFLWGKVGGPVEEKAYHERFAEVFNYATLPFYWPSYEPRRGQSEHANREEIARWCRDHGITPKGHPLAWNFQDPRWLPDDPEEVRALQMERIDEIISRFRGLVDIWDVVNEATHFDREGTRRQAPKITTMWEQAGRAEFVLDCFRHARRANPGATLLINDYRADAAYADLIETLIDESGGKPPFDVIGIQSHMHGGTWDDAKIWEVCERFARFGLPLHFTEATILSGERGYERPQPWPTLPEREAWQADEVERFYTMLFSHPAVQAITWWDFADRGAWQGAPAGFLRPDLSPKPAYERLRSLIKERWWTRASVEADARGQARLRAFLGDHHVKAHAPDGREVTAELTVSRGDANRLTVRLP